jgi:hypothetical protein
MRADAGRPRGRSRFERWSAASAARALVFALCLLSRLLYCSDLSQPPTEAQVKAAYLYNFGKFVRWQTPPESGAFEICVMGKNPFGSALSETVAGEQMQGKSIVARQLTSMAEASQCRILFISASEEGRLKAALAAAKRGNALTVSDIPGFAEHGGMIGLVNVGGRIRFEVNLTAVNDAGLNVSSELLKVAVRVIGVNQAKEIGR